MTVYLGNNYRQDYSLLFSPLRCWILDKRPSEEIFQKLKMILQTNPGVGAKKVPAGKVACPLCGGFISVSGGDRARFVDHISNEHDAKTDCHQVLLAISVLDERERGFLRNSPIPWLCRAAG